MRIAMLTMSDWAGSGFKTAQAINRHTEHTVHLIALKGNRYGHPRMDLVSKKNIKRLQEIVDTADIVHLKGDWPPRFYYWISFRRKPLICTVSGGFFRRKPIGQGRYQMKEYDQCKLLTAMTPDLCYRDDMPWTPHPIDSVGQPNIWEMRDPPLFVHSPTDRKAKDTDFILKVFDELKKKINFEVRLIEGVPFEEAVELRKEATMFFDGFKMGFYCNSAIEAMQFGIPVCAYVSLAGRMANVFKNMKCPVIGTNKDVEETADNILKFFTNLELVSFETKRYCDQVHSYQAIARLWDKLYKSI